MRVMFRTIGLVAALTVTGSLSWPAGAAVSARASQAPRLRVLVVLSRTAPKRGTFGMSRSCSKRSSGRLG
jgi:hypothetical protein